MPGAGEGGGGGDEGGGDGVGDDGGGDGVGDGGGHGGCDGAGEGGGDGVGEGGEGGGDGVGESGEGGGDGVGEGGGDGGGGAPDAISPDAISPATSPEASSPEPEPCSSRCRRLIATRISSILRRVCTSFFKRTTSFARAPHEHDSLLTTSGVAWAGRSEGTAAQSQPVAAALRRTNGATMYDLGCADSVAAGPVRSA